MQMFKMLLLALRHALKQSCHWSIAWRMNPCWLLWPRFNQMLLELIDFPHGFLITCKLRVGFSWCLQALLHWCGIHAARGESGWCILLWSLATQKVAAWHFVKAQAAGDFCFPVHHACVRALSCCDTRLRSSHQTWPPNRPDLSSVDYRLLRVI